MESLALQQQGQPIIPETGLNVVQHAASRNFTVDRRETCWFLEREVDVLAGYLFSQDYEMREGSD